MIDVEHWAEIRRMHFVDSVSIREIRRRTGLHRETIRRALAAKRPPAYRRSKAPSKLDPFKETPARGAAALCSQAHLPAHRLPSRRDLPVRPLGAEGRDPGRPRADPQGLGEIFGDDRPPRAPRRDSRAEGRQLPAARQGPGLPATQGLSLPPAPPRPTGSSPRAGSRPTGRATAQRHGCRGWSGFNRR
jgi:hypothetical protein